MAAVAGLQTVTDLRGALRVTVCKPAYHAFVYLRICLYDLIVVFIPVRVGERVPCTMPCTIPQLLTRGCVRVVVGRYQFPYTLFRNQARFHDFHHSKNVGAFGACMVRAGR